MTASLEKLYDRALAQFEGDQEIMDRVRQAYLQDQRYMTNFVRILLVPLSTALKYDFNGGGEATRDGKVKFTDLTEATGNGLTALALANTHLSKSSWKDVLKEFMEIVTLDQFYDIQYHSCMNNFEPVVWEAISEFEGKYGEMTGKMMGQLILASAFYNSRAGHVTKVRQILERDPLYDANNGDYTNQLEKMNQFDVVQKTKAYEIHMHGSHTLFEKPSLTRAEAEIKKKELEDKTQKSGGPKKNEGGALTFTEAMLAAERLGQNSPALLWRQITLSRMVKGDRCRMVTGYSGWPIARNRLRDVFSNAHMLESSSMRITSVGLQFAS